MALKYNCTICNMAIGYEGLCWKCKAEKERNEALNLTEEQIRDRQIYLIEHLQELGKRDNPADKYFWDCLSYHGIISVFECQAPMLFVFMDIFSSVRHQCHCIRKRNMPKLR